MANGHCPTCGRTLDEHNRHLRFGVPEPVLSIPEADRPARTWGNDVLMQVKDLGAFVRILVPVTLDGGYKITYGAWLAVSPQDLRRASEVWRLPSYADLRLDGVLANMLPGWEDETYTKPLTASVIDVEQIPYAVESHDPFMRRVLNDQWPHETVLNAIAPYERRFQ